MVEVFTTNIKQYDQAKSLSGVLVSTFPQLKISFDLWDSQLPYPCGHTVLRVEGVAFKAENIITTVQQSGFLCHILEDKACEEKIPKPEFWEKAFVEKEAMWGFQPAKSAILANDFFVEKGVKNVLVPGIGYGRNTQLFIKNGMSVTGIEISKTAIELARKKYGTSMTIYHGSVTDMPFDNQCYDAIFCYALIHLLDSGERKKLIRDCFAQLAEGGYMVFTAISKQAPIYGTGQFLSKDRYEMFGGVKLFFYTLQTIQAEFAEYGLFETLEIDENLPFFLIKCRKGTGATSQ